jgi:hypothetical protein
LLSAIIDAERSLARECWMDKVQDNLTMRHPR